MAHEAYSPVGYDYRAAHYCLDCIAAVVASDYLGKYIQDDGCNCPECVLDRIADDRGIDRHDEASYDMDDFPKHIPYFNNLHAECGPEEYGYGPEDPEWRMQYCDATCSRCHAVIDGTVEVDSTEVCPVWHSRKEKGFPSS